MATKLLHGLTISVVAFGTMIAAASCGKTTDGTDSNTHWMDSCDGDTDCGNLSCLCGVCTKKCTGESSCDELGSDATCSPLTGCGASLGPLCVGRGEGTGGSSNTGGRAATTGGAPASTGGAQSASGGTSAATGGTPGSGGTASGACAPMEAMENTSFCGNDAAVLPTRYHWNGTTCIPTACCTGKDCNKRFETAEACDDAHAACYTEDGIDRAPCTRDEDCLLELRACCFCGETTSNDVIAIRSYAQRSWVGNRCAESTGACPPCVPIENPALSAFCNAGVCRVQEVLP